MVLPKRRSIFKPGSFGSLLARRIEQDARLDDIRRVMRRPSLAAQQREQLLARREKIKEQIKIITEKMKAIKERRG
jgi:hypothetical protein